LFTLEKNEVVAVKPVIYFREEWSCHREHSWIQHTNYLHVSKWL